MDQRYSFIGYLACLVPFIIVPYYCVIGGWVMKYLFEFAIGHVGITAVDDYFTGYISQTGSPLLWFEIYVLLNTAVVLAGVDKGIEKACKFLMPVLIALTIGITIFCMTQPGAMAGVKYCLLPDFSRFSATTVLAAMGQLFYSMSLAMGIMITFGSYMKKENNLEQSVRQIEIFDTGIAFLAGLMIIPSVFAFSGEDKSVFNKGLGLMFVTLFKVFDNMKLGGVIGIVFFILVLFAALTSSISLMETTVLIIRDKTGMRHKKDCCPVMLSFNGNSNLFYKTILVLLKAAASGIFAMTGTRTSNRNFICAAFFIKVECAFTCFTIYIDCFTSASTCVSSGISGTFAET